MSPVTKDRVASFHLDQEKIRRSNARLAELKRQEEALLKGRRRRQARAVLREAVKIVRRNLGLRSS